MSNSSENVSVQVAIAWCLAWGTKREPQHPERTADWRAALAKGQTPTDGEWTKALAQAEALTQFAASNPQPLLTDISAIGEKHPSFWDSSIGLVYGGVTKVKSYVFESADLQEIRGASALLDKINLADLPALFHAEDSSTYALCQRAPQYCRKVRSDTFAQGSEGSEESFSISSALIPELIVYSTGGNLLAFCPAAFVDELCNAIEKRYTTETLTANSCAVGAAFRPLEIYCGLLKDPIEETLWCEAIAQQKSNRVIQAYFGFDEKESSDKIKDAFYSRKNFGELVGKLTSQFNQRRSGDDRQTAASNRPSRRYPPMFETHPYLVRDDSDIRSAVNKVSRLPDEPTLSEPTARKRRVGQITKRDVEDTWYEESGFKAHWNPEPTEDSQEGDIFKSWVSKFEDFLKEKGRTGEYDSNSRLFNERGDVRSSCKPTREARSLHEIGDRSKGYVGYIYADGNNMGQHIRSTLKTPADYQAFSRHIFEATEKSVYRAIADHIRPHEYTPDAKSSRQNKDPVWIHPFEIIAIGGDDVLLIVPANKAVEVAQSIGVYFEEILLEEHEGYRGEPLESVETRKQVHRYRPEAAPTEVCQLSTASGVLITAANTPIYYADKLVSQLLKSAKKHLKTLKKRGYQGGTVDCLVLKAVTMISSDIERFRKEGLTNEPKGKEHILKLQAAPYTLHELGGLIETVRAFKTSQFPKSQLYQIRSLLERGKRTAILNYRYFRVRLDDGKRSLIETEFETAWCSAKTNKGNLAPWITPRKESTTDEKPHSPADKKTVYETIWRELVELEPFIEEKEETQSSGRDSASQTAQTQERQS